MGEDLKDERCAYTPGPWCVVVDWDGGKAVHVRATATERWPEGTETVVMLPNRRNGAKRGGRVWFNPPTPETLANARLIAAAPSLLAACQVALAFVEAVACADVGDDERHPHCESARQALDEIVAAINQATGTLARKEGA